MKVRLTRLNSEVAFEASNETGQSIHFDGAPSVGGQNLGMRPMEVLASALASCTSIDILLIMKKKRIVLKHFEVIVEAQRKNAVPASFESVLLTFIIDKDDPLEAVSHAAQLSLEKYCSVAASLSKDIILKHEIKIR